MPHLQGVDVDRAGPADAGELLKLINQVQPHVPWNDEHLRWQFFQPPAGEARLYVIRHQASIVALYAAIRQRVRLEGEVHPAWMVQDVMTHPDHRGKGYLHRLGEACLTEIRGDGAVGYTFPNKQSEGSFRRTGWDTLCPAPARSAPVPGDATSESAPLIAPDPGFRQEDEEAWQDSDAGAGVERTLDFLRWRYTKPGQRYDRFSIAGDGGYMVLKEFRAGATATVHICDLVLRRSRRHLVSDALRIAFDHARSRGAGTVTAWLPHGHPYAEDFDRQGLVLQPNGDRWVFVTRGATVPWHLSQGDSDVY
jgi:GNAT superfamily N-acetyltransferase